MTVYLPIQKLLYQCLQGFNSPKVQIGYKIDYKTHLLAIFQF